MAYVSLSEMGKQNRQVSPTNGMTGAGSPAPCRAQTVTSKAPRLSRKTSQSRT
ncbi:MAG: hypothetical protein CJBNEKGG_01011 [Prosthecobacter sp.]|nr:hypothetical protein [Prosthecobacter sp.]